MYTANRVVVSVWTAAVRSQTGSQGCFPRQCTPSIQRPVGILPVLVRAYACLRYMALLPHTGTWASPCMRSDVKAVKLLSHIKAGPHTQ